MTAISSNKNNAIVIGAGAAGLASAMYLAYAGYKVTVIESHAMAGGCASFFRRKGMIFDVGATTLSGMAYEGPLKEFLETFKLDIKLERVDPGLCIHSKGKRLFRHADLNSWIKELQRVFPSISKSKIKSDWNKIEKINEKAWELTKNVKGIPPQNIKDIFYLFTQKLWLKVRLFFAIFKSTKSYFSINQQSEYNKIMDEVLLISTQTKAEYVSAMIGAMALSYLNDTWYCYGGMGEFTKKMREYAQKELGVTFHFNTKVEKIEKVNHEFILKTNKDLFKADLVISSIPIWNLKNLLSMNSKKLNTFNQLHPPKWGAMTCYIKVKLSEELKTLYHQIHYEGGSYFFSFSPHDDVLRNKDGYQTLTVSTHTELDPKLYNKKQQVQVISDLLTTHFEIDDFEVVGSGSPHTFEKFTGRYLGCVGGLPHSKGLDLLKFPANDLGIPGLYQVGDTTFPGQGVASCILGAKNLVNSLK